MSVKTVPDKTEITAHKTTRGDVAVLSPLDIQKKEFRRAFRGYSEEEVDSFLDRITLDYENLYRENQDLRERLTQADHNMARYREIEEVIKNTMIMAQKNAEDLRQNSEKETRLLVDQARIEADQLAREAEQEAVAQIQEAERRAAEMLSAAESKVTFILEEYHRLERETQVFRMRLRSLLEAQIKLLEVEEVDDALTQEAGEEEPLTEPA